MPVASKLLLVALLAAGSLNPQWTYAAEKLMTRCDPPAGSLSRLSRTQKKAFTDSQNDFIDGRFADALAELRTLLAEVPQNTPAQGALAERAAEAAIEAGDQGSAISLLKPIEDQNGNDCPARTLLARAYAEEGNSAARDAEIGALTQLHKQAPQSPIGKLDAFMVEKHKLGNGGAVGIWYALQPFGPHNTHILSSIADASGNIVLTVELDSDDPDQVYFKQIHPELAAEGDRRYSLDAFADRTSPDGKVDHEHALIQFFDGAPSYDTVRDRILTIADRSAKLKSETAPHNAPVPGK